MWEVKNCIFSTGREISRSDALRQKFVSTCHDGPRPGRCAGWRKIRGFINNVGSSRSLLITHTYGPLDINNVGRRGSLFIVRTAHFSVACM